MNIAGCVFSGQGSQYLGMGKDLYETFPVAQQIFDRAEEYLNFPIKKICFEGPEEALTETKNQQLGIVIVSAVCFSLIKENIALQMCAGLSLGEYTAVWAAGCIGLEDLLSLVQERSAAMHEAALQNPSTMVAVVDVPLEKIITISSGIKDCFIANINSPAQVVVSLAKSSVEAFTEGISQLNMGRAVVLNVSGGFHSPFMKSAEERLRKALERISFKDPSVPVICNIDARPSMDKDVIRNNLLNQLTGKVLWKDSLVYMMEKVPLIYETGPSRILKGLLRKFDRKVDVMTVGKKEEISQIIGTPA